MAIKIAISLTALSLIQIGMAEVWDRKGSAPLCRARPTGALPFYPSPLPHYRPMGLAWRGGSLGVVAVAQYHKRAQYKAETFAFSRIYCNIRKPLMPIRYPLAFRGTARPSVCSAWRLKVPKIERLTHPKPYIVSKLGAFPIPFACFSLFVQAETLYRVETRCFSETFCLFQTYLFNPKPSFFVELGAVVHQRETSVRFCHQRNLQAFFVTFCLFAFGRN